MDPYDEDDEEEQLGCGLQFLGFLAVLVWISLPFLFADFVADYLGGTWWAGLVGLIVAFTIWHRITTGSWR
jgi:cadmium resistance protein CadD (predicted permease)